jgi:IS5 family transposase
MPRHSCGSAHTIQAETLQHLNDRAAQLAAQVRVTRAQKLWGDGTVVETTIHHPTDSGLRWLRGPGADPAD